MEFQYYLTQKIMWYINFCFVNFKKTKQNLKFINLVKQKNMFYNNLQMPLLILKNCCFNQFI